MLWGCCSQRVCRALLHHTRDCSNLHFTSSACQGLEVSKPARLTSTLPIPCLRCCSQEPDCLTIGDGTVIDEMTFVMAHTVENRCLKFHGEHYNTKCMRDTHAPFCVPFFNSQRPAGSLFHPVHDNVCLANQQHMLRLCEVALHMLWLTCLL